MINYIDTDTLNTALAGFNAKLDAEDLFTLLVQSGQKSVLVLDENGDGDIFSISTDTTYADKINDDFVGVKEYYTLTKDPHKCHWAKTAVTLKLGAPNDESIITFTMDLYTRLTKKNGYMMIGSILFETQRYGQAIEVEYNDNIIKSIANRTSALTYVLNLIPNLIVELELARDKSTKEISRIMGVTA